MAEDFDAAVKGNYVCVCERQLLRKTRCAFARGFASDSTTEGTRTAYLLPVGDLRRDDTFRDNPIPTVPPLHLPPKLASFNFDASLLRALLRNFSVENRRQSTAIADLVRDVEDDAEDIPAEYRQISISGMQKHQKRKKGDVRESTAIP